MQKETQKKKNAATTTVSGRIRLCYRQLPPTEQKFFLIFKLRTARSGIRYDGTLPVRTESSSATG
jgi:hypothetical protein